MTLALSLSLSSLLHNHRYVRAQTQVGIRNFDSRSANAQAHKSNFLKIVCFLKASLSTKAPISLSKRKAKEQRNLTGSFSKFISRLRTGGQELLRTGEGKKSSESAMDKISDEPHSPRFGAEGPTVARVQVRGILVPNTNVWDVGSSGLWMSGQPQLRFCVFNSITRSQFKKRKGGEKKDHNHS